MFVSASFTVAKTWKQARYSSTGGRINKPIIHTMGHYAVLERNVLSSNLKTEEWEIHFFKIKETNVKKLYIYIYIYYSNCMIFYSGRSKTKSSGNINSCEG